MIIDLCTVTYLHTADILFIVIYDSTNFFFIIFYFKIRTICLLVQTVKRGCGKKKIALMCFELVQNMAISEMLTTF